MVPARPAGSPAVAIVVAGLALHTCVHRRGGPCRFGVVCPAGPPVVAIVVACLALHTFVHRRGGLCMCDACLPCWLACCCHCCCLLCPAHFRARERRSLYVRCLLALLARLLSPLLLPALPCTLVRTGAVVSPWLAPACPSGAKSSEQTNSDAPGNAQCEMYVVRLCWPRMGPYANLVYLLMFRGRFRKLGVDFCAQARWFRQNCQKLRTYTSFRKPV